MSEKERKRKRLIRTLIYVFAAVTAAVAIAALVISQLPPTL